jgi:pimeloyl-ACP methyl ester carboxylesterase
MFNNHKSLLPIRLSRKPLIFNQPTLVIAGTHDVFAPAVNSLSITERIPGAWLVQFNEGGHGLIFQHPEQFINIVKTFLESTNTP